MKDENFIDKLLKLLSDFGWYLYTKVAWRKNPQVQRELTGDIRDNLGYHLKLKETKE